MAGMLAERAASPVRYLGVDIDDALTLSERTEI